MLLLLMPARMKPRAKGYCTSGPTLPKTTRSSLDCETGNGSRREHSGCVRSTLNLGLHPLHPM